jgi:hypothetical protein
MGGHLGSESVAGLRRNMHFAIPKPELPPYIKPFTRNISFKSHLSMHGFLKKTVSQERLSVSSLTFEARIFAEPKSIERTFRDAA